jgi:hypothetical protein
MDSIFDHNLVARVLLTLATLGYGLAPLSADLNNTHATNPLWTPHARFHVVWQVLSYSGLGLLALGLIWWPGPDAVARLYLASAFAGVILVSFFLTFASMRLYGGANHDTNGYLPKPVAILGRVVNVDANTTVFSILAVVLVCAVAVITAGASRIAMN